jgi:predicted porin
MFAKDNQRLFVNNPGVTVIGNAQEARWNGGFVEADYNPIQLPKWLFIYRYDWITNTQQPDSGFSLPDGRVVGNFNNTQQHTAGIRYNFMFSTRTDIALHLEFSHLRGTHTAASGGDQRQDTGLVGLDFAF